MNISEENYDRLRHLFLFNFIECNNGVILVEDSNDAVAHSILNVNECEKEDLKFDIFFQDLTSYETTFNHIHLNDYFTAIDSLDCMKLGTLIAEVWSVRLHEKFEGRQFRIYLCDNEDDVTIRFHTIRANEANWLEEKDWENQIKDGSLKIWTR